MPKLMPVRRPLGRVRARSSDALAFRAVAAQPHVRFVAVKTAEQQA
jgi:hypothetical protein